MEPSEQAPLEASEVTKRYGSVEALAGLNLRIPEGSITALVGPNGAGKSTLFKTWVGFERPSSGRSTVWGVDPWRNRDRAIPHLGYVPQRPALYRSLSVADHLSIAARYRPAFDRNVAVRRLADLGVSMRAKAGELSGGQAAQLGLAIALGTQADTLVLDEPLASLDPLARSEFLDVLVEDVHSTGRTVVLSSHVVSDIAHGCDRIVVLAVGRKMLDDSIAGALENHWVSNNRSGDPSRVVAPIGREASPAGWLIRPGLDRPGDGRPAELEDIVMGYLSAGRTALTAPTGHPSRA